jgi:hypothetical protein
MISMTYWLLLLGQGPADLTLDEREAELSRVSLPVSPCKARQECRRIPAPTPDSPMNTGRMSLLVDVCSCSSSRRSPVQIRARPLSI